VTFGVGKLIGMAITADEPEASGRLANPCGNRRPPYIAEAPRVQTDGSQINSAAGPTARST